MAPTDLFARCVEALSGASQARLAEILGLGGGRQRVADMLSGRRPVRPGHLLDTCELLRQTAARLTRLADEVEPVAAGAAGGLHGVTPQALDYIGHVTSHEVVLRGPAWLADYAHPAETLRQRVAVELADGTGDMRPLAASRLLRVLGGLTDPQAVEVAQAAADVCDVTPGVPHE